MKVLFANRKNCFDLRGGDTVQMEKTKEYIEKLYPDVQIRVVQDAEEILNDNEAEIVHIFNIITTQETLAFVKAAKEKNKKVILSTIFVKSLDESYINYSARIRLYGVCIPNFCKLALIKFFNILNYIIPFLRKKNENSIYNGLYTSRKHKKLGREILNNADLILPNSDKELSDLIKYYRLNLSNKSISVPNATDFIQINNFDVGLNILKENNIPADFVLQVGRIEPRKNQLNVIKALYNNSQIPIVFIGAPHGYCYYTDVRKLAEKRGNVFFIENIKHEDVMQIYKYAKVHILPAFFETTGLVSLEAKEMGCEIVTSNNKHCPVEYYQFDKYAEICNPYDIKSIREAVMRAYNKKEEDKIQFSDKYKAFFSYKNVAKITYEAYKGVL